MSQSRSTCGGSYFRSSVSLLLVAAQVGVSIPVGATTVKGQFHPTHRISPISSKRPAIDDAAGVLNSLRLRFNAVASAAISSLNPPGELARLAVQFEEPLIATSPTSSRQN